MPLSKQRDIKIEQSWKQRLKDEFSKDYFRELTEFVKTEYSNKVIFPPAKLIFNAFENCSFDDVKVVILGQDPYHGEGQANGLAFSVNPDNKIPPSLKNIYKELESDLGRKTINQDSEGNIIGDLTNWSNQGVLLLNSTLTVQEKSPGSHQKKGWEQFTDNVIEALSAEKKKVVYLLWGKYAQDKGEKINSTNNLVITSPHPSPFSANRGFFGSRPFSKVNSYLEKHKIKPIDW